MGRLVLVEFLSVDGVVQGLGSPDEDRRGGFEHGGWGAPYAEDVHATIGLDGINATAAYLFGRRTYEKMAEFWPHQPSTNPIAAHMAAVPKFVASRTLRDEDLDWPGSSVLRAAISRTTFARSPPTPRATSRCWAAATWPASCCVTTWWTSCGSSCTRCCSAPARVCSATCPSHGACNWSATT